MFVVLVAGGLATALLSTEPAAQAAEPAVQPAQDSATAPPPKSDLKPGERRERVVCRSEATTGTRFAKRVCMSVNDLNRQSEDSRQQLVDWQKNLNTNYSQGN